MKHKFIRPISIILTAILLWQDVLWAQCIGLYFLRPVAFVERQKQEDSRRDFIRNGLTMGAAILVLANNAVAQTAQAGANIVSNFATKQPIPPWMIKPTPEHLSLNFKKSEFTCHCCETLPKDGINIELIEKLERLRVLVGKTYGKEAKIIIVSGYRCPAHNKKVGGAKKSQHMLGKAADIQVFVDGKQIDVVEIARLAKKIGFRGINPYKYPDATKNFTHMDVRSWVWMPFAGLLSYFGFDIGDDNEVPNEEAKEEYRSPSEEVQWSKIEIDEETARRFVNPDIMTLFNLAEALKMHIVLLGGAAKDFGISVTRQIQYCTFYDYDVAILLPRREELGAREDENYSTYHRDKWEALRRVLPHHLDTSLGNIVRDKDGKNIYAFEALFAGESGRDFGAAFTVSMLAIEKKDNKFIIFGTEQAINDLINGVIRVVFEGRGFRDGGQVAKFIARILVLKKSVGFELEETSCIEIARSIARLKLLPANPYEFLAPNILRYARINPNYCKDLTLEDVNAVIEEIRRRAEQLQPAIATERGRIKEERDIYTQI